MTRDHEPQFTTLPPHFQCRNYTGAIVTISMLIACLFAANLYTLDRLNSARQEESDLRSTLGRQISETMAQNRQLVLEYALLKDSHARQFSELKNELDHAAGQLGTSSAQVLNRARNMVGALEQSQTHQADALQEEIGQKADAQDLIGLAGNVSSNELQLGTTQKTLDDLEQDLGTARSQLGELTIDSHEQRQALQEATGGEFHEFTLSKNHPISVAQIGLKLRKANPRAQVFTLDLVVNDREIRGRDHSVFEPIILYLTGVRLPYEVVITAVGPDNVAGYVRVPKSPDQPETPEPRT